MVEVRDGNVNISFRLQSARYLEFYFCLRLLSECLVLRLAHQLACRLLRYIDLRNPEVALRVDVNIPWLLLKSRVDLGDSPTNWCKDV